MTDFGKRVRQGHRNASISALRSEAVPTQALVDAMLDVREPFVDTVRVFDVYRGASLPEGKKSVAFLVLMQDTQRTLTDFEVDAAMELMGSALRDKFKAIPR